MKKVYLYTNTNCRRRLLDTNKLQLYFFKNNFEIVNQSKDADFIIFVTCAYQDEITNITLEKIKEFQKYKGELIVAGCLPSIEEKKLFEIFKGKIICTKEIEKIDNLFPNNKIKFSSITDAEAISEIESVQYPDENYKLKNYPLLNKYYNFLRKFLISNILNKHLLIYLSPTKPEFYHVRISWGCLGNCSYCAIKKAIGPLKSKPFHECINEFEKGYKLGYKTFIITADDVGAYGIDIGYDFPTLLEKFTNFKGEYEISVQDLDPRWIVKYIDKLEPIFRTGKITSVNIALQSGCGKILKKMNRYSEIDKISEALIRLRNTSNKLSFDMHFIIGFPTETNDNFLETIDFIKKIDFDMGFIYRFSSKTGTFAEKIEPKVSDDEINNRIHIAKKLLKDHQYKFISLSKNNFYVFYKTS